METPEMPAGWSQRLDVVEALSLPAAAELADRWLGRALNAHMAELLLLAGLSKHAEEFRALDVEKFNTIEECLALLESKRAAVVASPLWATPPFGPRVRCARDALSLAGRILGVSVRDAKVMQERARWAALLAIFTAVRVDSARAGTDGLPDAAPTARAELDRCVLEAVELRDV